MSGATFQRRLVRETPEFIERQCQVLDARRAEGMNMVVLGDDGCILKIAPEGTETDVTEEATRRVEEARKQLGWND